MSIDAREFQSEVIKGYKYWECPYCKNRSQLSENDINHTWIERNSVSTTVLEVRCPDPACNKTTVYLSKYLQEMTFDTPSRKIWEWIFHESEMLYPHGVFNHYPDYVPEPIRKDYEEAATISQLSPKASAALIRRALQGMIKHKWPAIKLPKLFDQINALNEKVPAHQREALHGIRKIGNVGAHMNDPGAIADQDSPITVDDADNLIKLLEYLIKTWYVDEADAMALMKGISDRGDEVDKIQKGKK